MDRPVPPLPTGVVTFVLTDIVGSTDRWERDANDMEKALTVHAAVVADVVAANRGVLLRERGEGDSTFSVFARASDGLAAAHSIRRELGAASWPGEPLMVRIGVATGEASERDGDYFGTTVNLAARLRAQAEPGRVLVADSCARVVGGRIPPSTTLVDLGRIKLRGMRLAPQVYELVEGDAPHDRVGSEQVEAGEAAPRLPDDLPFVGRATELAVAARVVAAARTGGFRVLLLGGEPGAGKTRLAARTAARAAGEGTRVLYGRCDEHMGAPYSPMIEALRPALEQAARGPLIEQLLGSGFAPSEGVAGDARAPLFDEVVDAVARYAATTPAVLVLDDLHWITPSGAQLLRHIVLARPAGVALVATYRTAQAGGGSGLRAVLPDLARSDGAEVLELRGLSVDDVAELASELGVGADPRAVHDRTSGNAFFVTELLRQSGHGTGDELPASVRIVVDDRIARLPAAASDTLRLLAVLGADVDVGLVASLAPEEDRMVDALDELLAASLIEERPGGYRFAHDIVRHAVLASVSSIRRAELHARAGDAIVQRGDGDPHSPAFHYAAAARRGRAADALRYAARAARDSLGRLAFEQAIECCQRALTVTETSVDTLSLRADVEVELARALLQRGEREEAKRTGATAAADARASGNADALAAAALLVHDWGAYNAGDAGVARSLLEEALTAVGESSPRWRARLLSQLAFVEAAAEQRGQGALPLALEAVEIAQRLGEPLVVAEALRAEGMARYGSPAIGERLDGARELLDAATACGDVMLAGDARSMLAAASLDAGDRAGFETHVAELLDDRQPWLMRARGSWMRVTAAYLDGDWDTAEHRWHEVAAMGGDDPTVTQTVLPIQMYFIARGRGVHHELVPRLGAAVARSETLAGWRPLVVCGLLDAGDTRAARAALRETFVDGRPRFPHDLSWPIALSYLIEACVRLDTVEHLRDLVDLLAPYRGQLVSAGSAVVCAGAADRFIGLAEAALGDTDAASRSFAAALGLEQGASAAALVAQTKAARQMVGVRAARRPRPQRDRPATGWEALTGAESRVAGLVALGLTNREIAERLFLSRHTVDAHLRRVYAKLGVASRVEVAAIAVERSGA